MTTEDEIDVGNDVERNHYRSTEAGRSISASVLEAVAAASGRSLVTDDADDHTEALEPLYSTIDPDALDALLASKATDEHPPVRVEFTYCGYRVTADSTGLVTVDELSVL